MPSRLLPQVVARRGTCRLPFGSLLLAGATAKGILRVPSSNRRSRASESPRVACVHADSPPPNAAVNSLGTIRAFPGAAASGFFPTARRAGSSCVRTDLTTVRHQAVNQWIRSSGAFDGVIDFDAATRDPNRPAHILAAFDPGDHLHPQDDGYKAMADSIDLKLLTAQP